MRVRTLGPDGPAVTAVGCGDVSLARAAARGVEPRDVEAALCEAIERGITLVEVGDEEDAQRLIGRVVRELGARDRVVVACHVRGDRWIERRVEPVLRALRLDAPGLWLLDEMQTSADLAGACGLLVTRGHALRWGAAPDEPAELEPWLCAIACPWNACTRPDHTGPQALLARQPLAGGSLTGALGPGVRLAPGDDRLGIDLERVAVGVAKLARFVKHEPAAARSCDAARARLEANPKLPVRECATVAELALRLVIDRGAIALPRLHRREHVAEAIAAASAPPLSTAEQIFSTLDEA